MSLRSAPVLLALSLTGCIELDFFMFDPIVASSVDGDYHGLPLHQGQSPPAWIDEASIEREVWLEMASGGRVHGVWMPAPSGCPASECPLVDRDVTILYQHGNSGDLFRYWYRAVALHNLGASVFVYTYRGYGMSEGEASADNVFEDAEAALAHVRGRISDDTTLVAYGYSMGAIPTSWLVGGEADGFERIDAMILESGLDTPESIVNVSSGVEWPAGFFLDDLHFNGPVQLAGVDPVLPVLHLHGALDVRVLPVQAERYHAVLADQADYTHLIGLSSAPEEEWLARSAHRNVLHHAFAAELHIADYWDAADNPGHCCIHPAELAEPVNAPFLESTGGTDPAEMTTAAGDYAQVVAGWIAR